jgi:hypothetical protein
VAVSDVSEEHAASVIRAETSSVGKMTIEAACFPETSEIYPHFLMVPASKSGSALRMDA